MKTSINSTASTPTQGSGKNALLLILIIAAVAAYVNRDRIFGGTTKLKGNIASKPGETTTLAKPIVVTDVKTGKTETVSSFVNLS